MCSISTFFAVHLVFKESGREAHNYLADGERQARTRHLAEGLAFAKRGAAQTRNTAFLGTREQGWLVEAMGLEPTTPWLQTRCSTN